MEIRTYRPQDAHACKEMIAGLHEHVRALDPRLPASEEIVDPYFEYLHEKAIETEGLFLIAEIDGKPVAYLALFGRMFASEPDQQPGGHAYVSDLFVRPEYHGRRIGEALMARAEAHARHLGVPRLELTVHAGNNGALRFYEKRGYQERLRIMSLPLNEV